ncbi:MAG TPA: hypothetical protein VJU84_11345 [Pyrinomonadaceae bacterium]|nr:hypothetical protein [Pyrinomonadaceae bacterium]
MPQINCYLPIKLCITGRLDDPQLEHLSDTLVRAISARISFAERTIVSANGGNLWAGNVEIVREGYDPARDDAAGAYTVPSYQHGGHPTAVPVRPGSRARRPWIIRRAINFHAYVGDYLEYITNLRVDRTFPESVLYSDLFDELRWVSAWLVQVNRAFDSGELVPILYRRAAQLSHLRPNQIFAYGQAYLETNRQQLIAIDEDGVVNREIPQMTGNRRFLEMAGDNVRLNPGALLLVTTMTLPKIELADMVALIDEIPIPVRLRDLTFLVPSRAFEARFGISWEAYNQEFGDEELTLHLQPLTVRRRINFQALEFLVERFIEQRVRPLLTNPAAIDFGRLQILNDSSLGQLPPNVRARAEGVTNSITRSVSDVQALGHWDADWKGAYFLAVTTISEDKVGTAYYGPTARRLLPSLLNLLMGDPEEYGWDRNLLQFLRRHFGDDSLLTRRPGGNVFEQVLVELEKRNQFDVLFNKVERAGNNGLHQLLIQLSLVTRYATHARVLRSHQLLIAAVLRRGTHIYRADECEIWLERDPDDIVHRNQVFGEVDSIYIMERDAQRLKPARVPAFREALMAEREALVGRILRGEDSTVYSEDDFARATIGAAVQRINLSEDDFEEITIQRSMRLLRVEARMEAALQRHYITFEFVERVEGEGWQSASGPITKIEDEFSAGLIYWKLGRAGEVYEAMLIAMTVAGVAIIVVVAWEAGLIAALIQAAGGVTAVLVSIAISELIYVLRVVFGDARLSLSGFLWAAVDGYLMALGFGAAGVLGRAAARAIGTASLKRIIGGWAVERLIVGTVGGAGTAALTTFSHDLINVATGRGSWSGIGTYVRNMAWGALLGTVFEFGVGILQPLLRAGGENALQTLGQVVDRARAAGFTGSQWTALTAEALGNLNVRLRTVIGDVAAQGFVRAMGERLTQVAEGLAGQYRLGVFRRVLELSPGAMSRPAVEGLEKFLAAPSITNETALALLNRLGPTELRGFLEALNLLDSPMISALSRVGQIERLASAPQLAGVIRNDPVLSQLILNTSAAPSAAVSGRVQRILSVAQGLPAVPETIAPGQFFARGGTSEVFEVAGRPDLLVKQGGGRLPVEAQGLVELEMMGIDTVYAATRRIAGRTNIVVRRVDGVSSKDIIGRLSSPLRSPRHIEIVTQRTIDDLERIYTTLQQNRTNIGDFQFIVRRSDGAVFVNDPVSVTVGSGPSGNVRGIIDRFRRILRTNQSPGGG